MKTTRSTIPLLICLILTMVFGKLYTNEVRAASIAQESFSTGVQIDIQYDNGTFSKGSGTTFKRVTADGKEVAFIFTCNHVLTEFDPDTSSYSMPKEAKLATNKGSTSSKLFLINPVALGIKFDFAMIVVTNKTEIFTEADIPIPIVPPKVGDNIYAVGCPAPFGPIITDGIVARQSQLHKETGNSYDIISNVMSGGFSGGGIFDQKSGKYLGLVAMRYREGSYGIIIPTRQIITYLEAFKQEFVTNKDLACPDIKDIVNMCNAWNTNKVKKAVDIQQK